TATLVVLAATILIPMIMLGDLPAVPDFPDLRFYEWAVFLIAGLGLAAVVWARDRLTAVVSLAFRALPSPCSSCSSVRRTSPSPSSWWKRSPWLFWPWC